MVGVGNSAVDIAVEPSHKAEQVCLLENRHFPQWEPWQCVGGGACGPQEGQEKEAKPGALASTCLNSWQAEKWE